LILAASVCACQIVMAHGIGCAASPANNNAKQSSRVPLVYTVNLTGMSADERFTAICLQGIANRKGPRVYLNPGDTVRWMQLPIDKASNPAGSATWAAEISTHYKSIGDYWIDDLTKRGICTFQTVSLSDLFIKLSPELSGRIAYGSVDDDISIAATMAGVKSALPMTDVVYAQLVANNKSSLKTIFDVRSLYAKYDPAASKRISAHQWMVDNVIKDCGTTGAISRNKTYGLDLHDTIVDVDMGVEHKWATFDLNYLSEQTRNERDKPDPKFGFALPDAPLIDKVLKRLKPFSPVYGWGSPDENNTCRRITMDNCVLICGGCGNGSFYAALPRAGGKFRQPGATQAIGTPEKKIYVAFMTNEGDTIKNAANLQCLTWAQPERGTLPVNWGVDPLIYRDFPGLMGYYMATATPNDYFFAATAGWGYTHPERLPDDRVLPYADQVRAGLDLAKTPIIDIWWAGGLRAKNLFFPFLNHTDAKGLTAWSDHQGVEYSPIDGTPIIHSNYYYTLDKQTPEQFAAKMTTDLSGIKGPWFVVVYGGTPYKFAQVAQRLSVSRFEPVKLDRFFELARKARPEIEGKIWKPANAGKPEAAPGAGDAQTK
jgi:hypothetical protein